MHNLFSIIVTLSVIVFIPALHVSQMAYVYSKSIQLIDIILIYDEAR